MLITNAKLITWEKENRILENHALLIENDRIKEIGESAKLLIKHPNEEKLDARGQYVMPGSICARWPARISLVEIGSRPGLMRGPMMPPSITIVSRGA